MSEPDDLVLLTAQLEALRSQSLATTKQIEALLAYVRPPDVVPCPHPAEQREYVKGGTMGGPRTFKCLDCNAQVTESRPQAVGA